MDREPRTDHGRRGSQTGDVDAVIVGAGFAGLVHAPPPARARALGAGLRGGRRRRRHLVLEPLPGRALRRREHGLLVLVLRRAAAGVALDRALRLPAGDPELHQPRRRPLRPAPRHPARDARDRGRLRRGDEPVDDRDRPRRPRVGALLHHGHRLPVRRAGARLPGAARRFAGKMVSHRPLAARGRRLHRPAGRRHRHRLLRHPVDPDHRPAGRHLWSSSSARRTSACPRATPRWTRSTSAG